MDTPYGEAKGIAITASPEGQFNDALIIAVLLPTGNRVNYPETAV